MMRNAARNNKHQPRRRHCALYGAFVGMVGGGGVPPLNLTAGFTGTVATPSYDLRAALVAAVGQLSGKSYVINVVSGAWVGYLNNPVFTTSATPLPAGATVTVNFQAATCDAGGGPRNTAYPQVVGAPGGDVVNVPVGAGGGWTFKFPTPALTLARAGGGAGGHGQGWSNYYMGDYGGYGGAGAGRGVAAETGGAGVYDPYYGESSGAGGNGGAVGAGGYSGVGGTGNGGYESAPLGTATGGGIAGYLVRKNGNTVTVTVNGAAVSGMVSTGTVIGTVG